jgi:arabinogalactan oligomer/maltooligosaccharide transport system substrate-binding protein
MGMGRRGVISRYEVCSFIATLGFSWAHNQKKNRKQEESMKKRWFMLVALVAVASLLITSCGATAEPQVVRETVVVTQEVEKEVEVVVTQEVEVEKEAEPVTIVHWTVEVDTDGGLQFAEQLADAYMAEHPHVTIEVTSKDVETLREDYLTSGLAGSLPDLLWTVNDHAGPFTDAELIMAVDEEFDLGKYVDSAVTAVELGGKTWGVPIYNGNHLMLLYNKDLVPEPPTDTDELIAMAQELTSGDQYGLVFNQVEPFWLVPWLGGFGGAVFAEDGSTPTLDTQEMIDTLQFLYDIKYTTPIIPAESDYAAADTLFKEGKAAMIINGDWSLGDYQGLLGDKLGVARIPMVTETGEWPAPYTSGRYFMISDGIDDAKLEATKGFINFVTNPANQALQIAKMNRLPGLEAALDDPLIADNAILKGSADQMIVGTPMPTVSEMRCNWDAMKPEMQAVLADTKSPEDAAAAMQAAAEACIENLE